MAISGSRPKRREIRIRACARRRRHDADDEDIDDDEGSTGGGDDDRDASIGCKTKM